MGLDIAYLQEYQKYITAWWNVGTAHDMLQCLSLQLATWMELAVKNIKFYIKQTKQRLITGLHIKCPHTMTLNLPIMAFVLHVTHVLVDLLLAPVGRFCSFKNFYLGLVRWRSECYQIVYKYLNLHYWIISLYKDCMRICRRLLKDVWQQTLPTLNTKSEGHTEIFDSTFQFSINFHKYNIRCTVKNMFTN